MVDFDGPKGRTPEEIAEQIINQPDGGVEDLLEGTEIGEEISNDGEYEEEVPELDELMHGDDFSADNDQDEY